MVGNPDVKQALRVRDGDPTDVPNALARGTNHR